MQPPFYLITACADKPHTLYTNNLKTRNNKYRQELGFRINEKTDNRITGHRSSLLVAEAGLEPHDLRVMSPASYQLLHSAMLSQHLYMVLVTGLEPVRILLRRILSPLRLPIPPHEPIRKCDEDNIIPTDQSQGKLQFFIISKRFQRVLKKP